MASSDGSNTNPLRCVVFYKFGPCITAPCKSPFSLKLETYLRLTKIPYQVVCGRHMSPKGKMPWLLHRGANIADSQFCIEYLKKTFDVDLNRNMSRTDKGVAHAMRKLCEESLYWYMVQDRWRYRGDPKWVKDMNMSCFVAKIAKSRITKTSQAQGYGRHTRDELYEIAISDVTALSSQLGDKLFFFGDHPVEEDCAIFGQLGVVYYSLYGGVVTTYIKDNLSNLAAYCDRMRDLAWPDWDELLLKAGS